MALLQGDSASTERVLDEALSLAQASGDPFVLTLMFVNQGLLARVRGSTGKACSWHLRRHHRLGTLRRRLREKGLGAC